MRDFLTTYSPFILAIFGAVLLVLYLRHRIINKQWDKLREDAYRLIRLAEKHITGTKRGRERMKFVIDEIYSLIPPWIQLIIPEKTLREKLQEWFDLIKDKLDDGEINGSIRPPEPPSTRILKEGQVPKKPR